MKPCPRPVQPCPYCPEIYKLSKQVFWKNTGKPCPFIISCLLLYVSVDRVFFVWSVHPVHDLIKKKSEKRPVQPVHFLNCDLINSKLSFCPVQPVQIFTSFCAKFRLLDLSTARTPGSQTPGTATQPRLLGRVSTTLAIVLYAGKPAEARPFLPDCGSVEPAILCSRMTLGARRVPRNLQRPSE